MRTLVTGGLGFVGLNVAEALLARGDEVVVFDVHDALPEAARRAFDSAPGGYALVAGDVRDAAAVGGAVRERAVDAVIHAAAITPGGEREARDAHRIVDVNVMGTIATLEAAVAHGVRRFVYPSSASVYGANAFADDLLDEATTLPLPSTFYAIGKYAAERAVLRAREVWGLPTVVARLGATFGPWERDTGVRDTLSAPMLTLRAALRGDAVALPRAGPRDWVYARDVAAALVALLDAPSPAHDVYNVSAGTRWTLVDWCERLRRALPGFRYTVGAATSGSHVATIDFGDRDRSPLAVERLTEEMTTPTFDLDAAFDDYLAWSRSVDDFWIDSTVVDRTPREERPS